MMGFAAGTQNTSVLLVPFRTPPMKCQLSSTVEVIDSRLFHWMQEAQLACRILTVKHISADGAIPNDQHLVVEDAELFFRERRR